MRLEVRRSGGPACETCGSYPLLAILREPDSESVELRTVFADAIVPPAPWFRPFKKRWAAQLAEQLEAVESGLLSQTKYPIA